MQDIKVICLNLWLGGELFDGIIEFLKQEDPDILLLQEVFDGHGTHLAPQYRSMDVIRENFAFVADDFAATWRAIDHDIPERGLERGNAIFSKFPIIKHHKPRFFDSPYSESYDDHDSKNYPTAPRNLEHVTIAVHDTELELFNFQGVWDLDGENDGEGRLKMSRVIVEEIKDKKHVVLAGDTNVQPNTQTIRNIEVYLKNIFKGELKTSFNVKRKDLVKAPGYATAIVDMIFVSPELQIAEHYCPDVDVSDHLPLVATIRLPK